MNTADFTPEALLRHEAFVLALARSLVRDPATADDVAQETWLAALKQRSTGDTRGWLARIVRSRASNLRRGEARRGEHERLAARAEALEPSASEQEELELQHRVVAAVLALDEPYRGVVIAVYYGGRSPQDVARERGVPPGTVRSQLSRALEMLRAKLDRERGSRDAWLAALGAWVRRRDVLAPSATTSVASSSALPAAVAWSAALVTVGVLVAAVWWRIDAPVSDDAATPELARAESRRDEVETRVDEDANARSSAPVAAESSAAPQSTDSQLASMLLRMQQLKTSLIDRELVPEPDIAARYAPFSIDVTRLIDRQRFGYDLDVPWLGGGGAFYSFTQRTHDYQNRPQIALENGWLQSGLSGAGFVVDLGVLPSNVLFGDPRFVRGALDARTKDVWDAMQAEVDLSGTRLDTRDFVSGLSVLGLNGRTPAVEGHAYLVRSIELEGFDVLVAVLVERVVEGEGLTMAWRVLESRDVPNRKVHVPVHIAERASIEPIPDDLAALTPEQQLAEVQSLRERGAQLLFALPPELERLANSLKDRTDAGVVRLLDTSKPWTSFLRVRMGGAYYSFVKRSHGYDDEPDVSCTVGDLSSGFCGSNRGWFVELGDVPLDQAGTAVAPNVEAQRFLATLELPHSEGDPLLNKAWSDANAQARELGLESRVKVRTNTTWLLRSVLIGEHDVLVALRVAASDAYGCFVEWRVLRSWPVAKARR